MEAGIVAPDNMRTRFLDSRGEKLPAPPTRDGADVVPRIASAGLDRQRPTCEIQADPAAGLDARQHPGPPVEHGVEFFGRPSILDVRGEPADGEQLSGAGEAGPLIREPPPPGELLGQGAGLLIVLAFGCEVHALLHLHELSTFVSDFT